MRIKRGVVGLLVIAGLVSAALRGAGSTRALKHENGLSATKQPSTATTELPPAETRKTATFAAGCFRCSEAAFQEEPGVIDAVAGYAGGTEENPTYEQVSAHQTSHREAIQVTYNPDLISYEKLLEIFRRQIDPTDSEGQFVDQGFQYTTAIFYHDEEQLIAAEDSKHTLERSGLYDKPIVTKILPFTTFYMAEDFHQDFYKHSAERYKIYKENSGREQYYETIDTKREKQNTENNLQPTGFVKPSAEELQNRLTPEQFHITQENGTEAPFQNEYRDTKAEGIYIDVVSGEPLFSSRDKYDSGTGRPSFTKPIDHKAVTMKRDATHGLERTEVRSKQGDSHLGHVFTDGPEEAGGSRYCMNSSAMKFIPKEEMEAQGYGDWLYLFEDERSS